MTIKFNTIHNGVSDVDPAITASINKNKVKEVYVTVSGFPCLKMLPLINGLKDALTANTTLKLQAGKSSLGCSFIP
jgi:hypothetical protein